MPRQDTAWPEPPNPDRTGFRLATLDVPFHATTALPPEGEITGLLVTVRLSGPDRATFTLRHAHISSDVGLPGAGIPLEGGIHIQDSRARVAVYTSTFWIAFVGFVLGVMVLIGVTSLVTQPGVWNTFWLFSLLLMLNWSYRRTKAAIPRVVSDALDAVQRLNTSGRTHPWR